MVAFVVCGVLIVGFPETGAPGQKLSSPLVHCLRFFLLGNIPVAVGNIQSI